MSSNNRIKMQSWRKYLDALKKCSDKAQSELFSHMGKGHSEEELIDIAHALATKYGEASAELACEMYEALAAYQGASVPPAEPAPTATRWETARAIQGEQMRTRDAKAISSAAGRLVKLASVDTMMQNALRDGAEWAWIPSGDTCAFCLMLASNGWQKASKKAIKNGHAKHIHNNCDCTYCVRFSNDLDVEGYDPDALYEDYMSGGSTRNERINALRRRHYASNKDHINAQKRAAYARKVERDKNIANNGNDAIITNKGIASPIESRKHPTGIPAGIAISGDSINSRQKRILDQLPRYDSRIEVNKRDVSMKDLAALTAREGVEFAMFTKGGKRLVIRGDSTSVNILPNDAAELAKAGYRWSGHTHPGTSFTITAPSPGDRDVLSRMGHKYSAIYSSTGRKYIFAIDEENDIGQK